MTVHELDMNEEAFVRRLLVEERQSHIFLRVITSLAVVFGAMVAASSLVELFSLGRFLERISAPTYLPTALGALAGLVVSFTSLGRDFRLWEEQRVEELMKLYDCALRSRIK